MRLIVVSDCFRLFSFFFDYMIVATQMSLLDARQNLDSCLLLRWRNVRAGQRNYIDKGMPPLAPAISGDNVTRQHRAFG
jgi:hypothetical protein